MKRSCWNLCRRIAMRAKSCSLVSALLLGGLTATTLLVCGASPASAETSYHKLKKHLRTAEHNTGFVLGQIFAEAEVGVEIDLDHLDSDGGRSEQPRHEVKPAKPANAPAPHHPETPKHEPAKPRPREAR